MASHPHAHLLTPRVAPHRQPARRVEPDATRESQALLGLLDVLAAAHGPAPCERLLAGLAEALGQPCAALWVPRGDDLHAVATWCAPELDGESIGRALRAGRVSRGRGLAGRAWEQGGALDQRAVERPTRIALRDDPRGGLSETIAFACVEGQETLGIVALYGREPVSHSAAVTRAVGHAGDALGGWLGRRRGALGLCPLSPREVEVLTLAAGGHSVREIGQALTISPSTAKTHLEHIYRKLGVGDRTAAVAAGLRCGFIA